MNPNEHPLSERLEHLLSDGTPSGIPAADDLAQTIPAASPEFQSVLEDRLIEHMTLHPINKGDDSMSSISLSRNTSTTKRRLSVIPLTLAAAMVAVVLVGSVLMFRGGKGGPSSLAVVQESTPTPTAMVNIVVALQDLPRGYQFPDTVEDLSGVVSYAAWPESAVPLSALLQTHNGLEQLTGKVLRTDIFREQPILSNFLTDDLSEIANVGSSQAIILPDNRVAVSVPRDLIQLDVSVIIQVGDHVDISAGFQYVIMDAEFQSAVATASDLPINTPNPTNAGNCTEQTPCQIAETHIRDAIVVHIGDFGNSAADASTDIITLAVSPDEAQVLVWLVDSRIPLTMQPAEACSPLLGSQCMDAAQELPSYPGMIPTGMLLSHVPFDSISNDITSIHEGDLVDVTFSFLRPAFEPQDSNTSSPENGHIDVRTVLSGVKVYRLGDGIVPSQKDVVTLLLTQPDGALLSTLRNGNTPVAITLTNLNTTPVMFESLPDDRFSIDIQAGLTGVEYTSSNESVKVNILASMTFTRYNPEDFNSVGLEGSGIVSQVLVRDAEVLANSDGVFTLAVPRHDQSLLDWAIKSGIPLSLEASTS